MNNVYVIESDTSHPLLRLLGLGTARERLDLAEHKSSVEEWQYEAHRLEQQGKVEQAEEVRRSLLRQQAVPWTVLDVPALDELAERALDAKSVSNKPRQQLFEYAVFSDEPAWLARLDLVRFEPARGMLTMMDARGATIAQIGRQPGQAPPRPLPERATPRR